MTLHVCMTGEDLLAYGFQNNIIAQQEFASCKARESHADSA